MTIYNTHDRFSQSWSVWHSSSPGSVCIGETRSLDLYPRVPFSNLAGFIPVRETFILHVVPSCSQFLAHSLAIGIIGATVMPHSIFLGSALATQDRLSPSQPAEEPQLPTKSDKDSKASSEFSGSVKLPAKLWNAYKDIRGSFLSNFRIVPVQAFADAPKSHKDRENRAYADVIAHIYHGMVDIIVSLLGFAVVINSM